MAVSRLKYDDGPHYAKIFPIEVIEPLKDITADENSTVTFKCTFLSSRVLTEQWFKDGVRIVTPAQEQVTTTKQTFVLVLSSIKLDDCGMYNILCSNGKYEIFLKAGLFVRPMGQYHNNNGYIYSDIRLSDRATVRRHLMNIRVKVGERIDFQFSLQNTLPHRSTFHWYKNDKKIVQNDMVIILNGQTVSKLVILNANVSDTGLYHVIARTNGSISTSFAFAFVINSPYNEPVDSTEYAFARRAVAHVYDELRLKCKAKTDLNTKIQCWRNCTLIGENHALAKNIVWEDYGNGYFGIKIMNQAILETVKYTLKFINTLGNVTKTSSTVTYFRSPCYFKYVHLLRPLQSAVAYFGARVLFKCTFDMTESRYVQAVWNVGRVKVEQNDHRFIVLSSGCDFYLVIKRFEPEMAGLVTCELRQSVIAHMTYLFKSSSAMLSAVPPTFFEEELKQDAITHRNVYYLTLLEDLEYTLMLHRCMKPNDELLSIVYSTITQADDTAYVYERSKSFNEDCDNILMKIECCRFEDDIFCYLDTTIEHDEVCRRTLKLIAKVPRVAEPQVICRSPQNVLLKWVASNPDAWYTIDCMQRSGYYKEIGRTNMPMFEASNLPINKIIRFRVRSGGPPERTNEAHVTFTSTPTRPAFQGLNMIHFDTEYALGSYGKEMVIRGFDDFNGSNINTQSEKRKITVMKDCDVLNRFNHPNTVQLFDDFEKNEKSVFIMKLFAAEELVGIFIEQKHMNEAAVVPYVRQICEALKYLHSMKITHLDDRSMNIVCSDRNSHHIGLFASNLSRILEVRNITEIIFGIKDCVAPEVINDKGITFVCDMWSVGVVTYSLMSDETPLSGRPWFERSVKITRAIYNNNKAAFKVIPHSAKNFIGRFLVPKQSRRVTTVNALDHQWLKNGPTVSYLSIHVEHNPENSRTSYVVKYRTQQQRNGLKIIPGRRRKRTSSSNDRAE